MKNRIAIILTLVLLLGAGVVHTTAAASEQDPDQSQDRQFRGRRGHHFEGQFMGRMARHLELTDAQKSEIKSIIESEKPTIEPIVKQLAQIRKDMRAATKGGAFDEELVRALASQQAQFLAELIVSRERIQSKIYSLLTPEQKEKMEQSHQRHSGRMRLRKSL
jgi:periplasmic protein CpxP/Spy